ncbi:melanocortin-2 receptor accessory protein 2A [Hoplias malabaricus]|uniref:melanocortin-2 receptor accessory protein 2A n=1 Tax=Hoplias malabaricus TaxID=27720 RepID=UPI00346280F6
MESELFSALQRRHTVYPSSPYRSALTRVFDPHRSQSCRSIDERSPAPTLRASACSSHRAFSLPPPLLIGFEHWRWTQKRAGRTSSSSSVLTVHFFLLAAPRTDEVIYDTGPRTGLGLDPGVFPALTRAVSVGGEMPRLQPPNSTASAAKNDYEWRYEYYDDEEPVSFEGLKAHRYSIVIGFWVGLAVFVIFMFFVLTLLTKTGAPHPESAEPCEDCVHLTSCVEELGRRRDADNPRAGLSRPLLEESRFLFNCYINEEEQTGERAHDRSCQAQAQSSSTETSSQVETTGLAVQSTQVETREDEDAFLAHFNIPNFVNSELSSTLGEDDLLLGGPPIIMDSESHSRSIHHIRDMRD